LVRAAVRDAISAPDIEVIGEVGTGAAAIDAIDELQPDLVLLDIDLPDMSGLGVLQAIPDRGPTRVVILTVSGAHRDLIDAIRLGAVGYITKDVTPEALLRAVRAARAGDLPMPHRLAAAAIAELAATSAGTPPHAGVESLTGREREVLRRISDGSTDREAAEALGISTRTVEAHVGRILRKLGVSHRSEAARIYRAGRGGD
jgi:DNA-binding NarL/FixJ family response regulator